MKMKWCVIGAAGIADRRTIPALVADENNQLCAVMDKVADAAKAVGEKYGVPYYTDAEQMLKEVACDAVYIATPVFCHHEQAMLALKYDRNVLIEKPIARTEAESAEILDAFKKAGKQLSVGYMMKYHSLHQKARSFIKKDKVGKVNNVRLQFSCWYPDIPGAWRQVKALGGGGAIMDLGVHCLELAEYILDEEIVDVKSFINTQTFKYEVEDSAVIIFKTKSGTLGHIDVNFNIPDDVSVAKLEIYGTKGYMICNNTLAQDDVGTMAYLYAPQGDYDAMQEHAIIKPKKFRASGKNIYAKQLAEFSKHVIAGKPNYKYAKRAVHIQALCDKMYAEQ